jgi:hypothetical protein
MFRSFSKTTLSARDLNNDPTVWLDGTIQPHNHQIGLCYLLDGITIPKYKLLHFSTTKFFYREKALAFNRDRCCHLTLCLFLILLYYVSFTNSKFWQTQSQHFELTRPIDDNPFMKSVHYGRIISNLRFNLEQSSLQNTLCFSF